MWPFAIKSIDPERFEKCLVKVIEKVESSETTIWQGLGSDEVCMDLKAAIEEINQGIETDLAHIKMLFAPTGPIQDNAIKNGWTEDFESLSDEFNQLTNKR